MQSVALRLLCEREAEIEAFVPTAYWTVEAEASAQGGAAFTTELCRLDGAAIDEASLATGKMADEVARRIRETAFTVASAERDTLRRAPPPPFTTSTLQQEAARRLGFGIGETMETAQRLYEGVDLGDEAAGLITYMRTDSTAMAKTAVAEARAAARRRFGDDCVPAKPRAFRSRQQHAREAHEAIRPTSFERAPEALEGRLDRAAAQLLRADLEACAGEPEDGGPVRSGTGRAGARDGRHRAGGQGLGVGLRRPSQGLARGRRGLRRLCQVNLIHSKISVNCRWLPTQFQWLSLMEKCRKQLQSVNLMVWTPPFRRRVRQNGVWFELQTEGASTMDITTIGFDLAKTVFQVHGADGEWRAVLRRKLRRGKVFGPC